MDALVRLLNGLLMIALPLALGATLTQRFRVAWQPFWIGAATFVASQLFHLPFNRWVLTPQIAGLGLSAAGGGLQQALVAALFGLSAGLFEETARYLAYRTWLKGSRTWPQALVFGAGHGGVEAVALGGLALLSFFQFLALRDVDLASVIPPERLEAVRAQVEAYWSAPWYAALLGALERAFALCLHLSAAVLVLQAFTRRNLAWLGLAIAWHTSIDAVALFAVASWGPYVAEGLVGLGALVSLGIIFTLRTEDTSLAEPAPPAAQIPPIRAGKAAEITPEKLEDSRFSE